MELDLKYREGQTPIDDDEKEGLRIETIATREELDEFEQQNIEQAIEWSMKSSLKLETILTQNFVQNLHKKCMATFGHGQVSFVKPIRTLELTSGKSQLSCNICLMIQLIG